MAALVVAIRSNPVLDKPQWFSPCGTGDNRTLEHRVSTNKKWIRQLATSIRTIQTQLDITIEHYKEQKFNESYKDVQKGVDENQYVPNWLPGKGNVLMHCDRPTRRKISSYLPSLHTELQKFAIAMEAVIQTDPQRIILKETNKYLIQLLCEVEDALVMLQISVPAREARTQMTAEERNQPDVTRLLIRDWGILIKYRDYLHYWRELLHKVETQRKKQKAQKRRSKGRRS